MARTDSPAALNPVPLLRFMVEEGWASAQDLVAGQDIGEELGAWLDFRAAIALHALISPASPPVPSALPSRKAAAPTKTMGNHVAQLRAALERAIMQDPHTDTRLGLARIDLPPNDLPPPLDPKTAYGPHRRWYGAHQRQMHAVLRKLRAQLRRQLEVHSPDLQQLAALDNAFENILESRETVLLAKLPALFEKRFAKALKQHMKLQQEAAAQNEPAPRADSWLAPLHADMRTVLLAELDLRLQPVLGLLEALTSEEEATAT
jgi:hypothetical protein